LIFDELLVSPREPAIAV